MYLDDISEHSSIKMENEKDTIRQPGNFPSFKSRTGRVQWGSEIQKHLKTGFFEGQIPNGPI